ncbi:hypothetical protein SNOUR_33745 [Streptomyces noursei ATCC 11455]|nr:hypothetical protein SNOUR_33745 [Streptomyces noursei ATCC 11455]
MADDDSDLVPCPFGWHDMTQESTTVWTCDQHGATLVVGGLGPPPPSWHRGLCGPPNWFRSRSSCAVATGGPEAPGGLIPAGHAPHG